MHMCIYKKHRILERLKAVLAMIFKTIINIHININIYYLDYTHCQDNFNFLMLFSRLGITAVYILIFLQNLFFNKNLKN